MARKKAAPAQSTPAPKSKTAKASKQRKPRAKKAAPVLDEAPSHHNPFPRVPAKRGPKTSYTLAKADAILERMVQGETLRTAAPAEGVEECTFRLWVVADHDHLAQKYRTMLMVRAHGYVEDIMEIADDRSRDFRVNDEGQFVPDFDHINRARLRIDTRKWYLSKVLPKMFGEKFSVDAVHTGPNGGPVQVEHKPDLTGLTREQLLALEQLGRTLAPATGRAH